MAPPHPAWALLSRIARWPANRRSIVYIVLKKAGDGRRRNEMNADTKVWNLFRAINHNLNTQTDQGWTDR